MSDETSFENICCALLYMLSRQAQNPDQFLHYVIRDHLLWLANHQKSMHFPDLANTSRRLAMHWEQAGHENILLASHSEVQH